MGSVTFFGLCLLGILVSNPFMGAKASPCPTDWQQIHGICYGYFDDKKPWYEAEYDCQTYGHGSHLASILDEQQTYLLASYINAKQNDLSDVWIGLHVKNQKDHWRWSDRSLYSYSGWSKRQPEKNCDEDCVELKLYTGFEKWYNVKCSKANAYICEKPV